MGKASRNARRASRVRVGPERPVPRVQVYPVSGSPGARSRGSDVKQSGEVLGVCALCHRRSALLLSHIEPKWAYKWMKQEGAVLHTPSQGTERRMQDGFKHYLLCAACEQHLGVAENYLRLVTTGRPEELAAAGLVLVPAWPVGTRVAGLDHEMIRRGVLGIALKAHFAPSLRARIPFEWLVEKIRQSLLSDSYDWMPEGFDVAFKWIGAEGMNPRAMASLVVARLVSGGVGLRVSLAGVDWYFTLVAPGAELEPRGVFLVEDIRRRTLSFPDTYEMWDPSDLDRIVVVEGGDCPCGSGATYSECCESTWLSPDSGVSPLHYDAVFPSLSERSKEA